MKKYLHLTKLIITLIFILILNFICFHLKAQDYTAASIPTERYTGVYDNFSQPAAKFETKNGRNIKTFYLNHIVYMDLLGNFAYHTDTTLYVFIIDDKEIYIRDDKRTLIVQYVKKESRVGEDLRYDVYSRDQNDFLFVVQYDRNNDILFYKLRIEDDTQYFEP